MHFDLSNQFLAISFVIFSVCLSITKNAKFKMLMRIFPLLAKLSSIPCCIPFADLFHILSLINRKFNDLNFTHFIFFLTVSLQIQFCKTVILFVKSFQNNMWILYQSSYCFWTLGPTFFWVYAPVRAPLKLTDSMETKFFYH